MRFARYAFLVLFGLASFSMAHADTLSTFSFAGQSLYYGSYYPYTTIDDFNTVTGTAVIDITTGLLQSVELDATGQSTSGVAQQSGNTIITAVNPSYLIFNVPDLIGYAGSTFSLYGPNDNYTGTANLVSPVAVTPEPESFALLGTALLGLYGVSAAASRRRLLAA